MRSEEESELVHDVVGDVASFGYRCAVVGAVFVELYDGRVD